MKAIDSIKSRCVTSIKDLLALPGWDGFISDKLGNDLFLTDPDRADRIHEAAEHGCDGSTHGEVIDDWREFAELHYQALRREAFRMDLSDAEEAELEALIDNAETALTDDIDACEKWHADNGTLDQQGA